MTRICKKTRTCSICGEASEQCVCMSTSAFGSPDLDLRPPMLERSTMPAWYEKCPICGYVAPCIENETKDPAFIKTDGYRNFKNTPFSRKTPEMARDFYQLFLVAQHDDSIDEAFHALLCAAWACDDVCDRKAAIALRKKCLEWLKRFDDDMEPNGGARTVLRADLMRRARLFNAVVREFDGIELEDEKLNDILTFEVHRSRKRDSKCYTIEDAIG